MIKVYRDEAGRLCRGRDNYLNGIASPSMCAIDAGVEIGLDGMDYDEWDKRNTDIRFKAAQEGMEQGIRDEDEYLKQNCPEWLELLDKMAEDDGNE